MDYPAPDERAELLRREMSNYKERHHLLLDGHTTLTWENLESWMDKLYIAEVSRMMGWGVDAISVGNECGIRYADITLKSSIHAKAALFDAQYMKVAPLSKLRQPLVLKWSLRTSHAVTSPSTTQNPLCLTRTLSGDPAANTSYPRLQRRSCRQTCSAGPTPLNLRSPQAAKHGETTFSSRETAADLVTSMLISPPLYDRSKSAVSLLNDDLASAQISLNESRVAAADPSNTTLFVEVFSPLIVEATLRAKFEPFGSLLSFQISSDMGCGFVTFHTKEAAENAFRALNSTPFCGACLRVSWCIFLHPTAPVADAVVRNLAAIQRRRQNYMPSQPVKGLQVFNPFASLSPEVRHAGAENHFEIRRQRRWNVYAAGQLPEPVPFTEPSMAAASASIAQDQLPLNRSGDRLPRQRSFVSPSSGSLLGPIGSNRYLPCPSSIALSPFKPVRDTGTNFAPGSPGAYPAPPSLPYDAISRRADSGSVSRQSRLAET